MLIPILRGVPVVGNAFRTQDEIHAFCALQIFDTVELRPDPANAHDPFAVMVTSGKHHLGYLPKQMSGAIWALKEFDIWRSITAEVSEVVAEFPMQVRLTVTMDIP